MSIFKCKTCGGDLVLTIGSDTAYCDHCGQPSPVDPQDVKEYLDVYESAERLMRTGTLSGCEDALIRLRTISFIPQAKEAAELCEKKIEELRVNRSEKESQKADDEKKSASLGALIIGLIVLFLLAILACIGYAVFRLVQGDLSRTEVIVLIAVAAVFALLLIIGKIRSK